MCRSLVSSRRALRRHGSIAKAGAAYQKVILNDDGRYQERALFQSAQMQRRQKLWDAAIANYAKAALVQPTSNRANDARLWVARCRAAKGDADGALVSFRTALEAAERPRHVIAVSDWLAKALIERGDLDGAAAAIAHAERAAAPKIEAGGKDGPRLKKRLDSMAARKRLQKARDRANESAKDAARLERDRGK